MRARRAGFTLVEIMVVVVIIGLLAAMAISAIGRIRERSENATIANDLRTFSAAFEQYALETGGWPPDTATGVVPPGMDGRIKAGDWARSIPGNGRWDWDRGILGARAAISLFGCNFSDARLAKVDALFDDGNVNTGRFRRLSDGRPALVLED